MDTQYPYVALDVESLSVGSHPVITSVGAVLFGEQGVSPNPVYLFIDVQEQLNSGARVSQSTLAWWSEQNQELFKKQLNPAQGSVRMASACQTLRLMAEGRQIWCSAPLLDLGGLEDMHERSRLGGYGRNELFKYNSGRDVRTLRELVQLQTGSREKVPLLANSQPHCALSDALNLANEVTHHLRSLGIWSKPGSPVKPEGPPNLTHY